MSTEYKRTILDPEDVRIISLALGEMLTNLQEAKENGPSPGHEWTAATHHYFDGMLAAGKKAAAKLEQLTGVIISSEPIEITQEDIDEMVKKSES